jgi:hypothetical protein
MQVLWLTSEVTERAFLLGDWATTRRMADEGLGLTGTVQVAVSPTYMLVTAALIRLHSGDWEEAAELDTA